MFSIPCPSPCTWMNYSTFHSDVENKFFFLKWHTTLRPNWALPEVQGHMSITSKRSRVQFQLHPTSKSFITDTHKFSHYCKKTLISFNIYSNCLIIKWSHQMQVLTNVSTQNRTHNHLEVMLMWPQTSQWGSIWPQCVMPLEKKKLVFRVRMKSTVSLKSWLP